MGFRRSLKSFGSTGSECGDTFALCSPKLPRTITLLSLCLILPPHCYLVSLSYSLCHIPFSSDRLHLCVSAALIFKPSTHPCLQLLLSPLLQAFFIFIYSFPLSHTFSFFFPPSPFILRNLRVNRLLPPLWSWPFSFSVEQIDFLVSSSAAASPKAEPAILPGRDTARRTDGRDDGQRWSCQMSINFKWMLQTFSSPGHPNTQRCAIAFLSVSAPKPLAALPPAPTWKYPLVYSPVLTQKLFSSRVLFLFPVSLHFPPLLHLLCTCNMFTI